MAGVIYTSASGRRPQNGRNFVDDVDEGDLWYFPPGIPHSIQGLEPGGCEFLLAFPDGAFSEDSTFLLSDLVTHAPKDMLAKNFGTDGSPFERLPSSELHIFQASVPPPLPADRVPDPQGGVPEDFLHRLMRQLRISAAAGWVRIADSRNFPIAAALVELVPGAMRRLQRSRR
jgi:oxalate decarboxylase